MAVVAGGGGGPYSAIALHALIGKARDAPDIRALLEAFGPWESKTYPGTKTLSASEYLTNKKRGVQLCFDYASGSVSSSGSDGFLSSAHLFNDGANGFSAFPGALPHGLEMGQTNKQVVEMLGEPDSKGGITVPVWIAYDGKGLQITFKGFSFDDVDNPITSVTLFRPNA